MKISRCRSCNAEIIWATTWANGRRMPVDAAPVDDPQGGDFVLAKSRTDTPLAIPLGLSLASALPAVRDAVAGYRSHFATCPNADQHRRPRREVAT